MSMFTLTISYLITSNLPWFMDLTFQVPMQYCSLKHRILFPSPVTSTTKYCFCFGSISSFFLISPLISSSILVIYQHGEFIFQRLIFCLFILFMGLSRQEFWSGLPLSSLVDDILSELSTMTYPSWVALHCMAYSFIELDKAVVHVIRWLVFCDCGFQSVCLLMEKGKRLMEAS